MKLSFKEIFKKHGSVFIILCSLLSVMAVNANEMLIIGAESDNVILNFVSKLSMAFSTYNFVDLLSVIGVYFLINYIQKNSESFNVSGAVVSSILSFLYIWTFSYKNANDTSVLFGNSFQIFLTIIMYIGFFILFYIMFEFLCVMLKNKGFKRNDCSDKKNIFLISGFTILLCRIPWIIMNYPGSIAGDTIGQLGQYFSGEVNAHHPPLSTYLIGTCVKLGEILIDRNFGVFLYLLLQAVLGSILLAYSIYKMYELGISKICCLITTIFFALTPLFGLYSQWLQKDMLYSEFVLLYVILMINIVLERKITIRKTTILFLVGMLVCLLRNNGVYIIVPTYVFLAFCLKEKYRIRIAAITLSTIILYLLITMGLYPSLGIRNGSIREALSIPMQQTARYLRDHGDEVTEKEKSALEGFCYEYEILPEIYDPTCADPVKDKVNVEIYEPFNYFQTWLKMGLKHPDTYFDAFMNMNYGYLAPNEQNVEPDLSMTYDQQLTDMGFHRVQGDIPIQIFSKIVFINVVFPFLRYLTMPGFYTWIIIICISLLIKYKKKAALILLIPEIMTILVCLASPLCNGLRYELPVVFVTPLIVTWTWHQISSPQAKTEPMS